jgi:sec-independent protein translocase protein TatB
MFNIGWSELVVIAIVGFLILKPEDIPKLARKVGKMVGQIKEYMDSLSRDVQKLGSETDDKPDPDRKK